jgi:succinate dehydrogenase / fumarate reductase flavoprotein subunit
MPYPQAFQASLDALVASRSRRLEQQIPELSLAGKQDLLERFHPDFKIEESREIRIGSWKGQCVPKELAAVLESRGVLHPDEVDLSHPDLQVDVLVIGGGGAGTAAALLAHQAGASVVVATKLRHGDSNTIMAEGGIAAAARREDSPVLHYEDTVRGGRFANVPELVQTLVLDAPGVLQWLESLGVLFDRQADGTILAHQPAGHSAHRSHSCRDLTGLEIMRVLRDELRTQGVPVLEFSPVVELLMDENGRCAGAVLLNLDTSRYTVARAGATILATGGLGRLHLQEFPTSNHYGATGDGMVLAYRAGARCVYLDSMQYHPTGVVWPEQMFGLLVSEHLRARGTQLVNLNGERFINELETRDCVSAAILRECGDRELGVPTPAGAVGVWLDTPLIDIFEGPGTAQHQFAGIYGRFREFGIDPSTEPILIFPTQHYQNGGVLTDTNGQTSVPGLYAAGEVAGGVHGRNRLGANSLVDILVFGRRAGSHAAETAKGVPKAGLTLEHVRRWNQDVDREVGEAAVVAPILLPDYSGHKERECARHWR